MDEVRERLVEWTFHGRVSADLPPHAPHYREALYMYRLYEYTNHIVYLGIYLGT
jgi:hypothetical protein